MIKVFFSTFKIILSLVVVLGFIVGGITYTQPGRNLLGEILNRSLSSQDFSLQIKEIQSIFPLKGSITSLQFYENEKAWFILENVEIFTDLIKILRDHQISLKGTIQKLSFKSFEKENSSGSEDIIDLARFDLGYDLEVDVGLQSGSLGKLSDQKIPQLQDVYLKGRYTNKDNSFRLETGCRVDSNPFSVQSIALDAEGTLRDFTLKYVLEGENKFTPISHIKASGQLAHLPFRPVGHVVLDALHQGEKIGGRANAGMRSGDIAEIKLENFILPDLKLSGALEYGISTGDYRGSLKASAKTLSFLKNFSPLGFDLNGEGTVQFSKKRTKDQVSYQFQGKNFKGLGMEARVFSSHGEGKNLWSDQRRGTVSLEGETLTAGNITLEKAQVRGDFKAGQGTLKATAQGKSLQGKISAQLSHKENLFEIDLEELNFLYEKTPLILEQPSKIIVGDNLVRISEIKLSVASLPFRFSGSLEGDQISGKAEGELNLKLLSEMFLPPDHYVEGQIEAQFQAKGPLEDVSMTGEISLQDGLYENLEYGLYFNDINGQIRAQEKIFTLENFTAQSFKEGKISGKGTFDLGRLVADFNLQGENLKISETESLALILKKLALTLQGPLADLSLKGVLALEKGLFDIGTSMETQLKKINIASDISSAQSKESKAEEMGMPLTLNVKVDIPSVFKVQGRGLKSTWKGKIEAKGQVEDPRLFGMLELEEGSLQFLRNDFTLSEGKITFSGEKDNIPYVKIVTQTQSDDYEITILISGKADDVKFTFTSVPGLPRSEIISQILFGKLSTGVSAFEAIQLARNVAALTGSGPSLDVAGMLADTLGLDSISVGVDEESSSATVRLDKKLSDKLRVVLNQSSNLESSKIEIEAKIRENLTLNVEHGMIKPDESISLNYKKDY